MRSWSYKAITPQGKEVDGKLEAPNQAAAEEMLNNRRMRIVSLKKDPIEISIKIGSGINAKDISRFTRQFSSMCSAGLPILQCIDILADQAENLNLREVLKKVSAKIQGGSSLSEAMKEHPKVFNPLYCHMVAAGEAGGILDEVLRRQADYQEANNRLKAKIKKAMTYPILLSVVAVGAMIVLLTFVVPVFAEMFTASGNALPAPTQFVINLSDFLKKYLPFILAAVAGVIVAIKQYKKTPSGAKVLDGLKMKLPGVGPVETKGSVARFTRTLGTLLNAGVVFLRDDVDDLLAWRHAKLEDILTQFLDFILCNLYSRIVAHQHATMLHTADVMAGDTDVNRLNVDIRLLGSHIHSSADGVDGLLDIENHATFNTCRLRFSITTDDDLTILNFFADETGDLCSANIKAYDVHRITHYFLFLFFVQTT